MNIEENYRSIVLRRSTEHKMEHSWQSWLISRPLSTADSPDQTIGKAIGLAIFASDVLSSTVYVTQEMLVILALAGTSVFHIAFPLSISIIVLLIIIIISYEQILFAYPGGGGTYIVARDNLGDILPLDPNETAKIHWCNNYLHTRTTKLFEMLY